MVEGLLEAIRIAEFPIRVERQRADRLEASGDLEGAHEVRERIVPLESVVRLLKVQVAHAALHYEPLPDAELRAIMAFIREHTQFDRFDDPTTPNAKDPTQEG